MSSKKAVRFLVGAVAFVGCCLLALTPAGQDLARRAVDSIAASSAGAPARYTIKVTLVYEEDRCFMYEADLSDAEYREATVRPERVRATYVEHAKKRLAKKLFYFDRLYGDEASQIARVKVREVELVDGLTGRKTTLQAV